MSANIYEFEHSKIWTYGLSSGPDSDKKARERLRNAFIAFRQRAATLASEIGSDIPSLTVHDITHIDALWEMADLIIGQELLEGAQPFLNPLETFILGCAFLVHDLAHARSAVPLTDTEIKQQPLFLDLLDDVLRSRHAQSILKAPKPDDEDMDRAFQAYLRASHASTAENLVARFWIDRDNNRYYLLADEELRLSLGETIGRVASSHHWPIARLQGEFGIVGSPAFLPASWNCDLLKLACIIRLADAAHIDSRRSPMFLATIRKPTFESQKHWDFQQRIHRPVRVEDRLVYTSGTSFPLELADSWWLCFDVLNMIDRELNEVDSLLIETKRPRFSIKGVAAVENPIRISKYIPTQGWHPVDTQIRVGNVASLVSRLGGNQLYGDDLLAPLRELIQNGGDAIRARRLLEDLPENWGSVDVALLERDGHWILQVTDSGVGMSQSVLTGPLLDFGSSFWKSPEASSEYPGLKGKSFRSTGQYGVGFFSVFMLGKRVRVISRRYDKGVEDSKVLEFSESVYARPILRRGNAEERKICGTRVEIWLNDHPNAPGGLLNRRDYETPKTELGNLCAWLCPSFDVDIRVKNEQGQFVTVVSANDWKTIDDDRLLERINQIEHHPYPAVRHRIRKRSLKNMRPLFSEDGELLGRACIRLENESESHVYNDSGTITVGGCRSQSVSNVFGIFAGISNRASRDKASVIADKLELSRWANEQAGLIEDSELNNEVKANAAAILKGSGVSVRELPIALSHTGWLSSSQVREFSRGLDKIILSSHLFLRFGAPVETLFPNVLVTQTGQDCIVPLFKRHSRYYEWIDPKFHEGSLKGSLIEEIAAGWNVSAEELLKIALQSNDIKSYEELIGLDQYGNPVFRDHVDILLRP